MLWKCSSKHASEDGLLDETAKIGPLSIDDHVWNIFTLTQMSNSKLLYQQWYRMMEDYSRRTLSYETDKLPALAGITQSLQAHLKDTPVVGLWRNDLRRGLLWRALEFTKKINYPRMPSWSWASRSGVVNWNDMYNEPPGSSTANELEIISIAISWTGQPLTSPLSDFKLKVAGRLQEACIGTTAAGQNSRILSLPNKEAEVLGYCHLDEHYPIGTVVWCLEVFSTTWNSEAMLEKSNDHKVLILVPNDGKKQNFERIGVGIVWKTSLNQERQVFKDAQKVLIFLS
jgi:hypothetical protein